MAKKNILFQSWTAGLLFTALILTTIITVAVADEPSPEDQALALQNKYKSLNSLAFEFDQVTRTGTRERTGRGNAIFYRFRPPSEVTEENATPATQSVMRWNYTEPDPQVIVSDGRTLSIYTKKDKQLIRTPAKELESDITYAFFAGTRNLLDDFDAESADATYLFSSAQKLGTILLVPSHPHNQIRDVQVWFDSEGLIHHLMITDHFDSVTELNFDSIKVNNLPAGDKKTLEEIITFPVPPGTEIISR